MEMRLQTEDWALGEERHILVWHREGGEGGRAGKMDGTKKASIKVLAPCRCLHLVQFYSERLCCAYICVHIDVSLHLCMDLYR